MISSVRLRIVHRLDTHRVEGEITGLAETLLGWLKVASIDLAEINPRLRGKGHVTKIWCSENPVAVGTLLADGPVYVDGVLLESGEVWLWPSRPSA